MAEGRFNTERIENWCGDFPFATLDPELLFC